MRMKVNRPAGSFRISLISLSSCVIFLLTTVIGNFGVSDADVLLRQQDDPLLSHRGSESRGNRLPTTGSGSKRGTLIEGSFPPNIISATSTQPHHHHHPQQQTFVDVRLPPRRGRGVITATSKNEHVVESSSSSSSTTSSPGFGAPVEEQLYFRLMSATSRRPSPTASSFHKREERAVDDLKYLGESGGGGGGGVDIGYPLPLSMDDYWALDRDRLLDQLVIRALANPEEWTELKQAFEKVDGDLKSLLSLVKRRTQNQAVSDGTTNSSLEHPPSSSLSHGSHGASSSSSTQNQEEQHDHDHDHHHKWKFVYHRVHDLNAAGQPTSRGIAAVISLDTPESENESRNESSNSTRPTLKASSVTSTSPMKNGDDEDNAGTTRTGVSSSLSSSSSPSLPHFDDPIQPIPVSMGGLEGTSTNSNNIISNSLSRFGNKGKHVDLASDKSSSGDNRSRKSSDSVSSGNRLVMRIPSALVLPTERVSQGNEPNSHKIQWDPRHGRGGGGGGDGGDDELFSLEKSKLREFAQSDSPVEGGNDESSQHHHQLHHQHQHHPARHHHHFHKNHNHHSTHNQQQHEHDHDNHNHQHKFKEHLPRQMSFTSGAGQEDWKGFAGAVEDGTHELLFIPQRNNNNHDHPHQKDEEQQLVPQSPAHHHQKQNNHNHEHQHHFHTPHGGDTATGDQVGTAAMKDSQRQQSSVRSNNHHGDHHHHQHQSGSWKQRFHNMEERESGQGQ